MNIESASVQELRDELARLMWPTMVPWPITLDFVAAAFKETGWTWYRHPPWNNWTALDWRGLSKAIEVLDTGDEIADRLRLVVKVRSRA